MSPRMPRSHAEPRFSLSTMLFRAPSAEARKEFDDYFFDKRCAGARPDLTQRYTSTWPTEMQQELFRLSPQEWFDGLPAMVRDFLVDRVRSFSASGKFDPDRRQVPNPLIETGCSDEGLATIRAEDIVTVLGGPPISVEDTGRAPTASR